MSNIHPEALAWCEKHGHMTIKSGVRHPNRDIAEALSVTLRQRDELIEALTRIAFLSKVDGSAEAEVLMHRQKKIARDTLSRQPVGHLPTAQTLQSPRDEQKPLPDNGGGLELTWDGPQLMLNGTHIGDYYHTERGWRYVLISDNPSTAYKTDNEARSALMSAARSWLNLPSAPNLPKEG